MKLIDITDQRFGKLVVLRFSHMDEKRRSRWIVKCDCGTEKEVTGYQLRRKTTVSCGCHRRELFRQNMTVHGMLNTPAYRTWKSMLSRCTNATKAEWPRYGGRGIKVCTRWLTFTAFHQDMGDPPAGHSIDRINNDGHYEPGNCRWATTKQQNRNTSRTSWLTINGTRKSVADWSDDYGIKGDVVRSRLYRGWEPLRALTTPVRKRDCPVKALEAMNQ